jgi:hypothetical protein
MFSLGAGPVHEGGARHWEMLYEFEQFFLRCWSEMASVCWNWNPLSACEDWLVIFEGKFVNVH